MAKLVLTSSVHLDDDVVEKLHSRASDAACDINEFLIDLLIIWDECCEADLDQEKAWEEADREWQEEPVKKNSNRKKK